MNKYEYIELCYKIADKSFIPDKSCLRSMKKKQGTASLEESMKSVRFDKFILTQPALFGRAKWHTFAYALRHMREYRDILFDALMLVENYNRAFVAVQEHEGVVRIYIVSSESFLDERLK